MLEIRGLDKTYNPGTVRELCLFSDFSLTIPTGSFVSIVGSNGSGKTSLLNLICGSILADRGDILMDGKNITREKEHLRSRMIGRVFQNPAMGTCGDMTILENMALSEHKGKPSNLRFGTDKKRISAYRDMLRPLNLNLENMLSAKVGSLSGGQRQALALLMSTMTPISFLILDEHTAALDPKTSDVIMELTDQIVKEKKLTAMMVTHNLRYALEYGDRLIMMHQGGIVFDKAGQEKQATQLNDILKIFNDISIECGN